MAHQGDGWMTSLFLLFLCEKSTLKLEHKHSRLHLDLFLDQLKKIQSTSQMMSNTSIQEYLFGFVCVGERIIVKATLYTVWHVLQIAKPIIFLHKLDRYYMLQRRWSLAFFIDRKREDFVKRDNLYEILVHRFIR